MERFLKTSWLMMSVFFLAACVNNPAVNNPTEPNSEMSSLDGSSVWFSEDNSVILEVIGERTIVKDLYGYTGHSIVYPNNLTNDGALEVREDGDLLYRSIGAFSHDDDEIDFFYNTKYGQKVLKFFKAPVVEVSDLTGVWLAVHRKDRYFEQADIIVYRNKDYEMHSYYIYHDRKEYECEKYNYNPFGLVDGYKFINNFYGQSYFIKRFEAGKLIEYVNISGSSWIALWHNNNTQLMPDSYEDVSTTTGC